MARPQRLPPPVSPEDADTAPPPLPASVWRADQLGRAAVPALPSGFSRLDAELPGAGWQLLPGCHMTHEVGVLPQLSQAILDAHGNGSRWCAMAGCSRP